MSEGEREGAGPVVAVFGGSFDPPHVGHVLVACWARVAAAVDEGLVVPWGITRICRRFPEREGRRRDRKR